MFKHIGFFLLCLLLVNLLKPLLSAAVTPPTITPGTGTFVAAQTVSISDDAGIQRYYTTDGSTPTTASTPYTTPITISKPTQINAVGYDPATSSYSAVTTAYLDVDPLYSAILQPGLVARFRSGFGAVGIGNPALISKWIDLSGNGNDATATAGSEPQLVWFSDGPPAITFNGTNQYFTLPAGFSDFSNGGVILKSCGLTD
jgi:hypothetical protein